MGMGLQAKENARIGADILSYYVEQGYYREVYLVDFTKGGCVVDKPGS